MNSSPCRAQYVLNSTKWAFLLINTCDNPVAVAARRFVGAREAANDSEPFKEMMSRLVAEPEGQFTESAKLEAAIRANLKGLGYD